MQRSNAPPGAVDAGVGQVPVARPRVSHVYTSEARMPYRINPGRGLRLLALLDVLVGDGGWPSPETIADGLLEAQRIVNTGQFTWDDFDAGGDRLFQARLEERLMESGIDPASLHAPLPSDDVLNRDYGGDDDSAHGGEQPRGDTEQPRSGPPPPAGAARPGE
jgi:hypothetical protein